MEAFAALSSDLNLCRTVTGQVRPTSLFVRLCCTEDY